MKKLFLVLGLALLVGLCVVSVACSDEEVADTTTSTLQDGGLESDWGSPPHSFVVLRAFPVSLFSISGFR